MLMILKRWYTRSVSQLEMDLLGTRDNVWSHYPHDICVSIRHTSKTSILPL